MKKISKIKPLLTLFILLIISSSFAFSSSKNDSNALKKLTSITGNAVSEKYSTSKEIYSENKNAIVKILVYYDATFYAPDYEIIPDYYEYKVKPIIGSDNILGKEQWRTEYIPVKVVNEERWYGSGVVISSDGYILTNAHVANDNIEEFEELIKEDMLLREFLIIEDENDWGYYTEEEYEMMQYYLKNIEDNLKVDVSNINIKVVVGVDGTDYEAKIYSPEIIKREGGRGWDIDLIDYAFLKIDANNLDYVEIGNSDEISEGEQIYILGYPGVTEDWDETFEFKTDINPTIGSGLISNVRDAGIYKVFQLDVSSSGGNSGGAILDNQGKLIGIATYGSEGYYGGHYNYAIRINDILQNIPTSITLPNEKTPTIEIPGNLSNKMMPIIIAVLSIMVVFLIGLLIGKRKTKKK